MKYQILDLSEKKCWNQLVSQLPVNQQDVYYSPEYYYLYESNGDGKAECFVFEQHNNIAIYPFLKNPIKSLGYQLDSDYFDIQGAYGYNGVISSSYDDKFRKSFYETFSKYCSQNNIIAEFTRFNPLLQNQNFSEKYLRLINDRKVVFINLTQSEEDIWQNYSSVNRNMIRKAIKNNVTVEVSERTEDYYQFMRIYHENMKRVNADTYYYFNENYFRNLSSEFKAYNKLILAKVGQEILGGMILFFRKNYAHYHLSAQTIEGRKLAINNLYLHEAIKLAKASHCKIMHLGGGTSNNEKDPLLKFKSNYSKTYSTFCFGTKIYNQKIYDEVVSQWQKLNPDKKDKFNKYFLKYRY